MKKLVRCGMLFLSVAAVSSNFTGTPRAAWWILNNVQNPLTGKMLAGGAAAGLSAAGGIGGRALGIAVGGAVGGPIGAIGGAILGGMAGGA